ncbi:MAG: hypothetical protein ACTSYI_06020 [Promethearchaeota archaeon]
MSSNSDFKRDSRQKRRFSQISDTIFFEFQRFSKKTGILLVVAIAIFGLSLAIGLLTLDQNPSAFPKVENYIANFLSYMNMLVLILATSYGTGLIVVDFQEDTGNLLFPKISRSRLFIGRIIGNFLLGALIILIYYLIAIIPVFIKFEALPKEYWYSLGFSLYYYLALLSLAVFFSSFVKRSSGAVISVLLLMIIGFPIVYSILMLIVEGEPLYLLNYLAFIITYILNMPAKRVQSMTFEGFTINTWLTPDVKGATIGLGIYSFIFLLGAYIIYKYRQNTG